MQFGFSLSKKKVLIVMMATAVITSALGPLVSDLLRMPAVCAMAPVSDFVKASTSAFKSAMAAREEPVMSASEAVRLRKELAQWKSEAWARARGELKYWKAYRRVQKMQDKYGPSLQRCELIPARVILGEALPYGQSITMSQGTIHGVERGMRVIDVLTDRSKALPASDKMRVVTNLMPLSEKPIFGSALVGWVEAAGSFTARVRLITDKRFAITALVVRKINTIKPRIVTVDTPQGPTEQPLNRMNNKPIVIQLSGDGERGMITGEVARERNILPGDIVKTTGLTAKLPVDLRIGRIVSVERSVQNPNFVTAKVVPITELGARQNVFIVRSLVSQLHPSQGGN